MSQQAVEQIVGRLVTDEKFRKLFFSNPEEALKGHDLTPDERKALLKIKAEDVEGFSGKLDERITKGKMIL
jgi:hypothetical protein